MSAISSKVSNWRAKLVIFAEKRNTDGMESHHKANI